MFNSSTFIEHCKVAADYLVTVLRNDGRRVPKSFRFDKKAKFIRKRLQLHHRRREMTKLHCRSDIMLHVACQKLKRKSNLKLQNTSPLCHGWWLTRHLILTESPRRKFDPPHSKSTRCPFRPKKNHWYSTVNTRSTEWEITKKLRITCVRHILHENTLSASKLMFINNSTRDVLATIQFNIVKFTQNEPEITKKLDA